MRLPARLVVVLFVSVLAPAAWAEEEPDPKPLAPELEAPKPIQVAFGLEHVVPLAGVRPEGWNDGAGAMPDAAPTAESITAVTKAAGIEDAKARCLPLVKGEGEAAVKGMAAWLAIDVVADTFTPKLVEAAKKHGWLLKDIGVPQRVMITWGSTAQAAKAIQAWQVEKAVRGLCDKGWAMLVRAGQSFDPAEQQKLGVQAQAMIRIAGATEPAAGIYHAMMGRLLARQDAKAALEHNRKALKKDAPIPASDAMLVSAAFSAGQGLLLMQDESVLDEALAILEVGVKAESSAENPFMRFGNRYNLACAYARLGKIDEAFAHLEESLRYLKSAWEEEKKNSFSGMSQLNYTQHYDHAKNVDTDLEPLHEDERWAKVMAKYDPDPKPAPEPAKEGEEKKDDEKKDGDGK